jgi:hypothetical protein
VLACASQTCTCFTVATWAFWRSRSNLFDCVPARSGLRIPVSCHVAFPQPQLNWITLACRFRFVGFDLSNMDLVSRVQDIPNEFPNSAVEAFGSQAPPPSLSETIDYTAAVTVDGFVTGHLPQRHEYGIVLGRLSCLGVLAWKRAVVGG